ncbi:MAG TPA: hypothetical protein VGQ29_13960 [Gemmatimonadales bacterium]|nr:hypothetical protein [Gemmatimonadales bacterium]
MSLLLWDNLAWHPAAAARSDAAPTTPQPERIELAAGPDDAPSSPAARASLWRCWCASCTQASCRASR